MPPRSAAALAGILAQSAGGIGKRLREKSGFKSADFCQCSRKHPKRMKELTIALAIIMPIAACALNSWLNIKIKFAPDADQAKRDVRQVLFRIFFWLSNVSLVGVLVWQIRLPDPITRLSLVSILIPAFALFSNYVQWFILSILETISDITYSIKKAAEIFEIQQKMIDSLHDRTSKSGGDTEALK